MEPAAESKAEIEARARAEGAITQQLRQHDARLTANHDSLAVLRERVAAHDGAIQVMATEITETRTDVASMSGRVDVLSRNFFGAAVAMGSLMLAVLGLIVTILGNN